MTVANSNESVISDINEVFLRFENFHWRFISESPIQVYPEEYREAKRVIEEVIKNLANGSIGQHKELLIENYNKILQVIKDHVDEKIISLKSSYRKELKDGSLNSQIRALTQEKLDALERLSGKWFHVRQVEEISSREKTALKKHRGLFATAEEPESEKVYQELLGADSMCQLIERVKSHLVVMEDEPPEQIHLEMGDAIELRLLSDKRPPAASGS